LDRVELPPEVLIGALISRDRIGELPEHDLIFRSEVLPNSLRVGVSLDHLFGCVEKLIHFFL
jgi:hypothetical protein